MVRTKYTHAIATAALIALVGAWAVQTLRASHLASAIVPGPPRPQVERVEYKVAMQAATPTWTPTPGPTAGVWPIPTFGVAADPTTMVAGYSLVKMATMAAAPNATQFLTHTDFPTVPIYVRPVACCGNADFRVQFDSDASVASFLSEYTGTWEVQGWFYAGDYTRRRLSPYFLVLTGQDSEVTIPTPYGTPTSVPTPTGTEIIPDLISRILYRDQVHSQPTKMPMDVAVWFVRPYSTTSETSLMSMWMFDESYYGALERLYETQGKFFAWRP